MTGAPSIAWMRSHGTNGNRTTGELASISEGGPENPQFNLASRNASRIIGPTQP